MPTKSKLIHQFSALENIYDYGILISFYCNVAGSLNSYCKNTQLVVQCTGKYACFSQVSCLTLKNPL